jgi:hypothetical protein
MRGEDGGVDEGDCRSGRSRNTKNPQIRQKQTPSLHPSSPFFTAIFTLTFPCFSEVF